MAEHPIEGLMQTAMENIKNMTSVNMVVGDPVETPDGTVIIPVTRVSCGFAAGGGEFRLNGNGGKQEGHSQPPLFGGGSGGGVMIKPVAFLVVGNGHVRLLPVDKNAAVERIFDMAPQIISQLNSAVEKWKNRDSQKQPEPDPNSVGGI